MLILLSLFVGNPILKKYNSNIESFVSNKIGKEFKVGSISFNTYPFFSLKLTSLDIDNGNIRIPKSIIYLSPINLKIWKASFIKPEIKIIREKKEEKKEEEKIEYDEDSYNYDSLDSVLSLKSRFSFVDSGFDLATLDAVFSLKSLNVEGGKLSFLENGIEAFSVKNLNFSIKRSLSVKNLSIKSKEFITILDTKFLEKGVLRGQLKSRLKLGIENENSILNLILSGNLNLNDVKNSKTYKVSDIKLSSILHMQDNFASYLGTNGSVSLDYSLGYKKDKSYRYENVELELFPFYSKKYLSFLVNMSQDFRLSTILELRPDFRAWDSSIVLSKDVQLRARALESDKNGDYVVKNSKLLISGCETDIKAKINIDSSKYNITLGSNYLNFDKLNKVTSKYGFDLPKGELKGVVEVSKSKNSTQIKSSQLILKDFNIDNTEISYLELRNLNTELNKDLDLITLSTDLDLNDLKAKVGAVDHYKVGELSGNISVNKNNIKAELDVRGFFFHDTFVYIENLDAEIKDFNASYSKDEGFKSDFNLIGKSMFLRVPDYQVSSIESLNGPVKVEVDSSGKYRVYGTGDGKNALMKYLDKDIRMNGLVHFDVSKKFKDFTSSSLIGQLNNKDYHLQDVDFEIIKDFYVLKKSNLSIFSGQANVQGRWGRRIEPYEIEISLNDISLSEFDDVLSEKKDLSGTIEKLNINVTGNKSTKKDLKGQAEVKFRDGVLKSLELDTVLSNPSKKKVISENDPGTYVENLEFKSTIDNGALETEDLVLAGKFYTFKGKGQYSFDEGFRVKGAAVYLEKTLSELGGPVKFLRTLFGNIGKVEIPVKIKGKAEDPEVEADLGNIHRLLSPGRAVENIGKGMENIFDEIKDVVNGE